MTQRLINNRKYPEVKITLTGDLSGTGSPIINTTINAGVVGISNLSATGTPSSTTYLRGDNTWATISGGTGTVTSIGTSAPLTGGTITTSGTIGITQATTSTDGYLSSTDWSTFNSKESALTFSTGLTRTTNTITANLSTGVSGGQSVIGGNASGNNLTLSSTSNATKGKIIFGTSAYDEVNNRLGIGTTTPGNLLSIVGNSSAYGGVAFNVKNSNVSGDTRFSLSSSNNRTLNVQVTGDSYAGNQKGAYLFTDGGLSNMTFMTDGGVSSGGSGYISFATGGFTLTTQERMRITSTGNIGIGTTNPGYPLDVVGAINSQVTGASVNFVAQNPGNGYPRGKMLIDYNNSAPNNVGFAIAPAYGTNSQFYQTLLAIDNNKVGTNSGYRSTLILQGIGYASIAATGGVGGNSAGDPLKFSTRTFAGNNSGLVINNDTNQTVNIGTDTLSTTAQLNVVARSTLYAATFAGNVGIGQSSPTAVLHLKAGTATANTAPLKFTTGTNTTVAVAGQIEYNNTFHLTNSDATRRHIVTAPNTTKVTASAPYTNDGYIIINIGGTDFKVMTTA